MGGWGQTNNNRGHLIDPWCNILAKPTEHRGGRGWRDTSAAAHRECQQQQQQQQSVVKAEIYKTQIRKHTTYSAWTSAILTRSLSGEGSSQDYLASVYYSGQLVTGLVQLTS